MKRVSKKKWKAAILCFLCCMTVFSIPVRADKDTDTQVKADKITESAGNILNKARIIVTEYTLDDKEILPGEEFKLKIKLKNQNKKNAANNITLTFTNNLDTIFTTYGMSNQVYIERLKPLEEKEITLNLKTSETFKSEGAGFAINILYADSDSTFTSSDVTLQIPVNLSSHLLVQGISIPQNIQQGSNTRVRVTLKNAGGEDLRNITMNVTGDGLEQQQSVMLGQLSAGKINYVDSYINFKNSGKSTVNISFNYEDINGNVHTKKVDPSEVTVVSANIGGQTSNTQSSQIISTDSDATISSKTIGGYGLKQILLIGSIAFMSVVVIVLIRRYRK
ncbi:MAG: CARDB domain-containing protein [bacterium]|nr:CARDB domain-containing protein [bacterium]